MGIAKVAVEGWQRKTYEADRRSAERGFGARARREMERQSQHHITAWATRQVRPSRCARCRHPGASGRSVARRNGRSEAPAGQARAAADESGNWIGAMWPIGISLLMPE